MRINKIKYAVIVVVLVLCGCSTKKNTSTTRAYHNLTSRYNVLFNGTESFKKGMLDLQKAYSDNYNELLPIFLYNDEDQLSPILSAMDRSIKKATKLISSHSITVKPEIKDGKELDKKEREFYSKLEFNKWVDDAYLLMAKAHLYKNEMKKAEETFAYLQSNFPDEPTRYESKIWLARIAIKKGRRKEAQEHVKALLEMEDFPKPLMAEREATIAELALTQDDYQLAISSLKKAAENTRSKYHKQRYTFIVAQLYQEISQVGSAAEYYKKVIRLNPPYEMTFNAQINMALTFESGVGSMKDIERQLQKMIKDDKNIEFQDQIYYAWGNLYYQSGNTDKAIEFYKKAANSSAGNNQQLALIYLSIADINYEKPVYISAQAYYDSTVAIIDASYPDYSIIYAKSISLTNLVDQLETLELKDSVLKLAELPKPELYAHIDKIIETEKTRKEEERLREQEQRELEALGGQQQFELQTKSNNDWYFYNPTAVNLGRQEFKRKWGNRKLEDAWRRKDRKTVSFEVTDNTTEEIEGEEGSVGTRASNAYSREFYLADIPFTDSAVAASHVAIQESLFEMGNIYSDELKDYSKAENAYKELLSRYPGYNNKLLVYYRLYSIGKSSKSASLTNSYKQKIISEFPNSNYAKVLSDPDYFKKIEEEAKKVDRKYTQTLKLFENDDFAQSARLARETIQENPEHELVPQFEYILTLSEGVSKDTAQFIDDLEKLIAKHPGSDLAVSAGLLVNYLQNSNPEAAVVQKTKVAVELYKQTPNEIHYLIITVKDKVNSNQMMFNVINFNLDNFEEEDLKVRKYDVDKATMLSVVQFKSKQLADEYKAELESYPDLWRDVNSSGSEIFIISTTNYEILKTEKNLEQYLLFYKENYLLSD